MNRAWTWRTPLLATLLLVGSCAPEAPSTTGPESHGSVSLSSIILNVNSVPTLQLGDDGTVVNVLSSRSDPIIQHRCGPQVLQPTFLRPNGQPEALITTVNYLMDIYTDNEGIAHFERWDRFVGNLKGLAVGTTRLNIALISLADSTTVLGPFHIQVKVEEVDKDPC
jgi:hypothetical protein